MPVRACPSQAARLSRAFYPVGLRGSDEFAEHASAPVRTAPKARRRFHQRARVVVGNPVRGEVRWFSDRKAGIVFEQPLKFEELAEWIATRLEVATLKASTKG